MWAIATRPGAVMPFVASSLVAIAFVAEIAGASGRNFSRISPDELDSPADMIVADLSHTGMVDKSTTTYTDVLGLFIQSLKSDESMFVDFNQKPISASEVRNEFLTFCADGDYSDRAHWLKKSDGSLKVQFSCVKDGEYPALRERLYVATLRTNPDTLRLDLADLKLLSADLAPESQIRIKAKGDGSSAITRATIAISGAMLLSAAAAKREYPGRRDSVMHSAATGLIAASSAAYLNIVEEMSPEKAALAGGALSILVGGAKEAVDPYAGGVRSRQDMKSNLLGGAVGAVTVYMSFIFL